MSGRVSFVRYRDAADVLEQEIRDLQGDDRLAAVTVVVSSRRIGHSLRHRLACRSASDARVGIANVRFLTLADLADELGGAACRAGGRLRLTRSALGAAARVVLASDPGALAAVSDQPSTEAEIVTLYEELRHYGEETINALERRRGFGPDLARLCTEMRSRLATGWYDDADLIDAAVAAMDAADVNGAFGEATVVHLPERMRPDECRLIAAIARHWDLVVDVGITGDVAGDAPSARIASAMKDAGLAVPSMPQASPEQDVPADGSVRVDDRIEAPDVDAEVRAALRVVIEHLDKGGAPSRVALLYPSARTYLGALAAALDESSIVWNGRSPRRVAESPAARALLGVAGLARDGLARDRVIAWINSAPIVDANGDPLPLGAFERASRLAGVTTGDTTEWRRHLQELIAELSRRSGVVNSEVQPDDENAGAHETRALADLQAARALDAFIVDLGRTCEEARRCVTWTELERWSRDVLRRYLRWTEGNEIAREGADANLDATLTELGRLSSIEYATSVSDLVRALGGALERAGAFEGRLSCGIVVSSLWDAVGLELDLAVVLGGVEGELPPRARSSPLLSSDDRSELGLEAATSEAVSAASRHALVALVDATHRTVCTWRLRDAGDARARVRSRFFGHDEVMLAPSSVAVLSSIATGERTALSGRELVVATLRSRRVARRGLASFHLVRADADLQAGLPVIASRLAYRFDRYNGRIGPVAGVGTEKVLSPTTLENYARCPFKYFLSSQLGIDVVREPEKRTAIAPRDRGSIVHEVLEEFISDLIDAVGEPALVDTAEHLLSVAERVFGRFERLGLTGAPVLWTRERRALLTLLEKERQADAQRRATEQRFPFKLEWSFGSNDVPPLEVSVRTGSVAFRGKVDRIDRRSDGALLVVDYKTGRSEPYDGIAADPVDAGLHLQLPIYALAARSYLDGEGPVSASYRFLDEGGVEQTVDLETDVVERTSEVVGVITDGVSAGLYPFNPGPESWGGFENCRMCDFKAICPSDRDDFWEEASKAPDLAPYVSLVGGDDDE